MRREHHSSLLRARVFSTPRPVPKCDFSNRSSVKDGIEHLTFLEMRHVWFTYACKKKAHIKLKWLPHVFEKYKNKVDVTRLLLVKTLTWWIISHRGNHFGVNGNYVYSCWGTNLFTFCTKKLCTKGLLLCFIHQPVSVKNKMLICLQRFLLFLQVGKLKRRNLIRKKKKKNAISPFSSLSIAPRL